jgi:hypothetical protein
LTARRNVRLDRWKSQVSFLAAFFICVPLAAAENDALNSTSDTERNPLSIGMYFGDLFKTGLPDLLYEPQRIKFSPSYLIALNLDYRFYRFERIPLQFEGEFDVGKRFNGANQLDIAVTPMVRWMAFPWNRLLYTNLRAGALGFSYATGISDWERQNSGDNKGSRLLQFLVVEVTFAASEHSRGEAFVRVHHRSGDYGLFDGSSGGSNYLAVGYRISW